MASPTPGQSSNLGVAPNVGGLLCYFPCCVGLIVSIVVAIVEKQSRFLRFHGLQSLLLHGAAIGISICLGIGQIVLGMVAGALALVMWLLSVVVGLAFLGAAIMMMVKAYGNEEFELPVIGEMAKKWA